MFGRLGLDSLAFILEVLHNPVLVILTLIIMFSGGFGVALMFKFKKWGWLWRDWLCTVDHKKIGIMYILTAVVMLARGIIEVVLMRAHQTVAVGANAEGLVDPGHFDQLFTTHGVVMILFMAMPLMTGLMNVIVPLQIGARDMAFPYLNAISFWLFIAAALLINASLFIGEFAHTGWTAYPPFAEKSYSPGVGVDYWIWSIQLSGLATTLTAVNLITTIIKMRCPGMSLMKMPLFTWTTLFSMLIVMLSFPALTASTLLLTLDRYLDMHIFTGTKGGSQMMYVNTFWLWGHPEVYIVILPAFGVFSEVFSTFCKKYLFGYKTMVYATGVITILSIGVWLHHFFTMGAGAHVNVVFGLATMIISLPTGAKVFNWLFTIYKGKLQFTSPVVFSLFFLFTFVFGGLTGVILSVPGIDFQVHNSLFLVAHFHNQLIGGAVYGFLAGLIFWFPKIFGVKLKEGIGKAYAWFWGVGFFVAFLPLYYIGINGATRRMHHYTHEDWQPYFIVAAIGAAIIVFGVLLQVIQLLLALVDHKKDKDHTGDPWDGRTLEWSTSSPPPFYNFAITPKVDSIDAFWVAKQNNTSVIPDEEYKPIHMPKNTSAGFLIGVFSFILGFSLVWYIYWLALISFIAIIVTIMWRSFQRDTDYYVTVEEIKAIEDKFKQQRVL